MGGRRFGRARVGEEEVSGVQGVGERAFGRAGRGGEEACVMQRVGKKRLVLCVAISLVSHPP